MVVVSTKPGMISLEILRWEVYFTLFSSLRELVQGSSILCPWLPLGSTFFLVTEPGSWRGVWAGEDGIGNDCPWGRGFVFVWDIVYCMKGLGLLLEILVLGSALFWPIFTIWPTLLL